MRTKARYLKDNVIVQKKLSWRDRALLDRTARAYARMAAPGKRDGHLMLYTMWHRRGKDTSVVPLCPMLWSRVVRRVSTAGEGV